MYFSLITQPQYVATAAIRPARIIAASATVKREAAEATAASVRPIGVSFNRYKYPLGSYEQVAYPYLAEIGDAIGYYGPGQEALVLSGAAISNLTSPVISDNAGRAVTSTTEGDFYVGWPLETASAANLLIRVQIDPGVFAN